MPNLAGQVAVVTGAGSGIGQGIALALAHAGADLLVADIDLARAHQTAQSISALQRHALPWQTDVRDKQSIERMTDAAVQELGRLDICVANAGIGRGGLLLTMTVEDWDSLMAVNLTGVFLLCRPVPAGWCGRIRGDALLLLPLSPLNDRIHSFLHTAPVKPGSG